VVHEIRDRSWSEGQLQLHRLLHSSSPKTANNEQHRSLLSLFHYCAAEPVGDEHEPIPSTDSNRQCLSDLALSTNLGWLNDDGAGACDGDVFESAVVEQSRPVEEGPVGDVSFEPLSSTLQECFQDVEVASAQNCNVANKVHEHDPAEAAFPPDPEGEFLTSFQPDCSLPPEALTPVEKVRQYLSQSLTALDYFGDASSETVDDVKEKVSQCLQTGKANDDIDVQTTSDLKDDHEHCEEVIPSVCDGDNGWKLHTQEATVDELLPDPLVQLDKGYENLELLTEASALQQGQSRLKFDFPGQLRPPDRMLRGLAQFVPLLNVSSPLVETSSDKLKHATKNFDYDGVSDVSSVTSSTTSRASRASTSGSIDIVYDEQPTKLAAPLPPMFSGIGNVSAALAVNRERQQFYVERSPSARSENSAESSPLPFTATGNIVVMLQGRRSPFVRRGSYPPPGLCSILAARKVSERRQNMAVVASGQSKGQNKSAKDGGSGGGNGMVSQGGDAKVKRVHFKV
jgi:hypothetical protein